jgi:hypothetical protein
LPPTSVTSIGTRRVRLSARSRRGSTSTLEKYGLRVSRFWSAIRLSVLNGRPGTIGRLVLTTAESSTSWTMCTSPKKNWGPVS